MIRAAIVRFGTGLLLAVLTGCVSVTVDPVAKTNLMTSRAGDTVNLEWQTQKGMIYTVTYSETLSPRPHWIPLPQATRVLGTGSAMRATDRVPFGARRFYNIVTEPAPQPRGS